MLVSASPWAELSADAKRARLLTAAADLFARDGLDATMPEIAGAVGAGVASVYRCYPSKQDLIIALVKRRLEEIRSMALEACAAPGPPHETLLEMLRVMAAQQATDDLFGVAYAAVADRPTVAAAKDRTTVALEAVIERARISGSVRADMTAQDLHLLFAATRASRVVSPDGWRRVLELFIDAFSI